MIHVSDRFWNNSRGSAAQLFLAEINHRNSGISLYDEEHLHKTTQTNPKHAKKLMRTSAFQANLVAYYLWSNTCIAEGYKMHLIQFLM